MTTEPHDPPADRAMNALLDGSAPLSPLTDAVPDSALREVVRGAEWEARRVRRRTTPRAIVLCTVVALTLGSAGAAAAATLSGWELWAENPDSVVRVTLPSGAACEFRTVVRDGDPADVEAAKDVLDNTDALASVDIDSELARVLARDVTFRGENGDIVASPADLYTEDELYRQAVTETIINHAWDELEERGVVDPVAGSALTLGAQSDCADFPK